MKEYFSGNLFQEITGNTPVLEAPPTTVEGFTNLLIDALMKLLPIAPPLSDIVKSSDGPQKSE